jgi:hypothetical protein
MYYEITPVPYVDLDGGVLDPRTDDYEIDNDQYWSGVGDLSEEWE